VNVQATTLKDEMKAKVAAMTTEQKLPGQKPLKPE